MPHTSRLPALALALALTLTFALSSAQAAADPQLDAEEQEFVTLINNYRQQNGLSPLTIDWALEGASDWLSTDMGQKAYFSHVDSLGRVPSTRMCDFGYCYNTWKGENIAAGFITAQSVFTAWQNSSGHDANMLGTNYAAMGVSRVYTAGSPHNWYWTNDFGGVQSNAPPPAGCSNGLPASLIPGDSDCDGFPDTVKAAGRASETRLGTDPTRACASTSTPDDEPWPDAWPMDFNDDRVVNAQDSGKFGPAYNKPVSLGPFGPYSIPGERFDLNGDGLINGQDTGKFQAYLNEVCT